MWNRLYIKVVLYVRTIALSTTFYLVNILSVYMFAFFQDFDIV